LEQRRLREPDVQEHLCPLRRLDIGLAVRSLSMLGGGCPKRSKQPDEEVAIQSTPLRNFFEGVARIARLEDTLHRQQHQAILLNRLLQLLERHTPLREVVEQRKARLPGLPLQTVEQALGLEIELGPH